VLLLLTGGQAQAESLFDNTNLALFEGLPDVLADGIKPYDERLWEIGERIGGKRCCERKMYRVDNKKLVILSHEGAYFLLILITGEDARMFIATKPGIFVEQPLEKGATWTVPDWLTAAG